MNILLHFDADPLVTAKLRAWCGCDHTLTVCAETDEDGFERALAEADVIWHVLRPITAAHFARAPHLKAIQKLGVGVNTIALDAARSYGVSVCNAPGANSQAVAEMTLLLILSALRRMPDLMTQIRVPGGWALPKPLRTSLAELKGRTVGLVGFGSVPKLLAPWLETMGANIVYSKRHINPDLSYRYLGLDALLEESDIVSLHVPLTEQTRGIISSTKMAIMKTGSILVNTARGELIDQPALIAALAAGRPTMAVLDVFEQEPIPPDHPLLAMPQVIATPHVAWMTGETLARCLAVAIENVERLASGRILLNQVVPP